MDLLLVELEFVKQENEYLKNKLKCANEIEAVLREKIEKNEVKLKSFRNASELVGQYHEKNKPCVNIAIGLDYDALNSNNKDACDNEKKNTETTPTSKAEKKPMVNQDSKTPVNEMKTEDGRKMKKNRNGNIGINKSNNFAYIVDAPRKQCQKYGSVNHLLTSAKRSFGIHGQALKKAATHSSCASLQMSEGGNPSRYVKLTKEQAASTEDIRLGELNQPIDIPQRGHIVLVENFRSYLNRTNQYLTDQYLYWTTELKGYQYLCYQEISIRR
ncbi:hypothetical protein AgCh_011873 [Apium graveolens]